MSVLLGWLGDMVWLGWEFWNGQRKVQRKCPSTITKVRQVLVVDFVWIYRITIDIKERRRFDKEQQIWQPWKLEEENEEEGGLFMLHQRCNLKIGERRWRWKWRTRRVRLMRRRKKAMEAWGGVFGFSERVFFLFYCLWDILGLTVINGVKCFCVKIMYAATSYWWIRQTESIELDVSFLLYIKNNHS